MPSPNLQKYLDTDWQDVLRHDIPASFVVFLVALPLSLGIALASGAPVMAGVISAITGGIVVGILGGAPMQVSGPAAGLTVIVFSFIQQFGWGVTCAITVGAGILQTILGAAGIAPLATAVSPAVLHGMLAAIGILIALSQFHVVLGLAPAGKGLTNLFSLPGSVMKLHPGATVLGLLTIATIIVWTKFHPRCLRSLPASLVAVTFTTIISVVFKMNVPRVTLTEKLFTSIQMPILPAGDVPGVLGAILTLTLVASAESLLCALATDQLHTGRRCSLNKELVAQGVGNMVSGALGGLPVSGVIVRSKASLAAGAKTRASAILHGIWILVFVALLPGVIAAIPLSVLAGLLVYTGIRLVSMQHLKNLHNHGEMLVYGVTALSIICINLLAGLAIGFTVALLKLFRKLAHFDIHIGQKNNGWHVLLSGSLTFAGIPKLISRLKVIPPGADVELSLKLQYLDHAGYEALHTWQAAYEKQGGRVLTAETEEALVQPLKDIWVRSNTINGKA